MPFLATPNATMYYDIFEPDFTTLPFPSQMHTVLLIHGFGGSPESDFGGQLAALRSHFRVIVPHLHGYGRSTQRSSYALSFYRDDAADLATLLDTLDIDKVLVLGFGDGGIVGLLFAALYPQRVLALAVMGAQPSINEQNVAAIRHWLLETPLAEDWQKELAKLHGEPYWRSLPRMYVEGQEALVAAGGGLITAEELPSIPFPPLIFHAQPRPMLPPTHALILSDRLPNS